MVSPYNVSKILLNLVILAVVNHLLAMSIGQSLCIDFSISKVNFLTTLRSYLDVTCSCYFWSSLVNVDVNYSYIDLFYYS